MNINLRYYKTGNLVIVIAILSIFWLAVAYLFSWAISLLPSQVKYLISAIGFLSIPSFAIFILWYVHTRWWNHPKAKWLIWVPDVSGRYTGTSTSKHSGPNGDDVESEVAIEISQTASNVHLKMYHLPTEVEREYVSESLVAELIEKNEFYHIQTIYRRRQGPYLQPDRNSDDVLGSCRMGYIGPSKELRVEYFNENGNVGYMDVEFESKKLKQKY